MPTYDYQCKTCGHRFEYFQSMSSDALTKCPVQECIQEDEANKGSGDVIRRVSGGAGLVFKGEGFYQTDYVRKADGTPIGNSGKSVSQSSSTTKSESKGSASDGGVGAVKSAESGKSSESNSIDSKSSSATGGNAGTNSSSSGTEA